MGKNFRLAFVGPSGAGKGTFSEMLKEVFPNTRFAVSATTRKVMRPGEIQGVSYDFMSTERFEELEKSDYFAETNPYCDNRYGTPRNQCDNSEHNIIFDVDVNGAGRLKAAYPDLIIVFLLPPSQDELITRLRKRGEDEDSIKKRLARSEYELTKVDIADIVIVNDDLKVAFSQLFAFLADKMDKVIITLDGYSGAGKEALGSWLAQKLGATYLDSGRLYRCLAWHLGIRLRLDPNSKEYQEHLHNLKQTFDPDCLDQGLLKTQEVEDIVGLWARLPDIRNFAYMNQLRCVAQSRISVADGRDMAILFPSAKLKVFVDVERETRIVRRAKQRGLDIDLVRQSITERDRVDSTRTENPAGFRPEIGMRLLDNNQSLESARQALLDMVGLVAVSSH